MRVVRSSFWWLAGATCIPASIAACTGKFGSERPDPENPPPGPCPGGEVMMLVCESGGAATFAAVVRDLRDVLITPGGATVRRFRSAKVLVLTDKGEVARTVSPPDVALDVDSEGTPIGAQAAV